MKKLIFALLFLLVVIFAGYVVKIAFISQSGDGSIKQFTIKAGENSQDIAQNLKNQDLLDNAWIFKMLLKYKKQDSKLKTGEHFIQSTWSMNQIINTLVSGKSLDNEAEITIIEGWNLNDIGAYLEKEGIAKAEDFFSLVGYPGVDYNQQKDQPAPQDLSADYEFLKEKPKNLSYEGYLFPDTYRIFKNATLEDIVRKMLDNFDRKITSKMIGDLYNQDKKLYEILILASIIEKEARNNQDKKTVAGVYHNRLELGMPLQADPTVNYVTGKVTDRPTYDDIATDNFYNTYKYPGLPPGPICNPGLDSITAAIYPEKHDYYYFLNTPAGKMIFSRNFDEHKRNRLKYFKD